jgi:23S rRNA (adenine2503-C2)-methyltransferase
MILLNKIFSKTDNTIKYIFQTKDEIIIEMAYINKEDGKDIICVPSQTSCKMGCKFCHITDASDKLKYGNLTPLEIIDGVNYIYNDLELIKNPRTLLISYMGCGEPLINMDNVISSMTWLKREYQNVKVPLIRFAIATSLPYFSMVKFFELTEAINSLKLPVKIHLSLHYTNDELRKEWMPESAPIIPSIIALEYYQKRTGNSVEIHYALIDGVNDTEKDAILLTDLLKNRNIPVKFLFYNEKPTIEFHASSKEKINIFKQYFEKYDIKYEYYIPPGLDVGASCGQFLMDYYLKYNTKKE